MRVPLLLLIAALLFLYASLPEAEASPRTPGEPPCRPAVTAAPITPPAG